MDRALAAWSVGLFALSVSPAWATGPPAFVASSGPVEPRVLRAVADEVGRYRAVLSAAAPPGDAALSPERVAAEERRTAVRLALDRAKKQEGLASWDDCVREAAGAMSDAIDVIAYVGDRELVRDLHLQAGTCMSLAGQADGARLHFIGAALLDESPPMAGLHREEAEQAQRQARAEVLRRPRGKVRIVTEPSGADVWIDGRLAAGTTPLDLDVRLGEHFVTARRFRYEPNTEERLLEPSGLVRIALDPAHRQTLRDQLAAVANGEKVDPSELTLARAAWSRAEQLVEVSVASGASGYRLKLMDVLTGRAVRSGGLVRDADGATVRKSICSLLDEPCEVSHGVPWYVWPLAGAAVVGGVVTTVVVLENNRQTLFCPPSGCR
jgi:hypothetical protein